MRFAEQGQTADLGPQTVQSVTPDSQKWVKTEGKRIDYSPEF